MKIMYKCHCAEEIAIDVPDRVHNTDIHEWINIMQGCIGYDHHARSPLCRRTEMEYVKIPVPDGTEELGKPVIKQ